MKKYFKGLLLLPMLVLASCGTSNNVDPNDPWAEDDDDEITLTLPSVPNTSTEGEPGGGNATPTPNQPTPDNPGPAVPDLPEVPENPNSEHITYLVLGKNGLFNGKKGEDIKDKFLENTVVFHSDAGTKLPGKDKVTSSVEGVEFVSWISYEDQGKPTIYKQVQKENGKILYAFFQKTGEILPPDGGEGEGGEGGGETGPTDPVEKSTVYVNDTKWENVYIHAWKNNGPAMTSWADSPKMNKTEKGFTYDLPKTFDRVIFASSLADGAAKTETLTVDHTSDKLCYHQEHKSWGKLDDVLPDLPKPDPTTTIDIYCKNPWPDWGVIKCHYWNDKESGTTWPGKVMEKVDGMYKITIDKKYTNLIFTDGRDDHKIEIKDFQSKGGNVYDLQNGTWSTK